MNAEITIVESKEGDFEDIVSLFHQLWPGKRISRVELINVFGRSLASENNQCLSVKLNDKTIGFCAIVFTDNFWQEGTIAQISTMIIEETYRNKGIGKLLLQKAISVARDRNCKKVELESSFHRESAHAFYEKNGFRKRAYYFSFDIQQ